MTSVYPELDRTAWIIAQRPPRGTLDPSTPHGFFLETELSASGRVISSSVIFLTNKECPWRCLMCDLWKNTLSHGVQPGAIPAQIEYALGHLECRPEQIKLYNSGSFFDPAAIPVSDYPLIAEGVSFAKRVIVECHPRLVGKRAAEFRDLLVAARGSSSARCSNSPEKMVLAEQEFYAPQLEVAIGLETVHPDVLPRLNKKFDLGHFASAAGFLVKEGIDLRAFILVKPPFLQEEEAIEWTVKSAEFAFDCGATVVSLIPTRSGNGAMERLIESGEFSPPHLYTVEKAFEACLVRCSVLCRSSESATGFSTRNSPSPQPSPLGRGSPQAYSSGDGSNSGREWFPLSPGERVGVRGNRIYEHHQRRIFVDSWNLEQFSNCRHCLAERKSRLEQMNMTQQILPAINCSFCGGL